MKKNIIISLIIILLFFIFIGCERYGFSWEDLPDESSNNKEVERPEIFWCENMTGSYSIKRAFIDNTSDFTEIHTGLSVGCYDMELNESEGKLYYTQNAEIYKSNLDGTNNELVLTAGSTINYIDIDNVNNKIYYNYGGNVRYADLDGNIDQFIASAMIITGIAVDPINNYIYYGRVGNLIRAELNGSNTQGMSGYNCTADIAVDPGNNIVYWSVTGGSSLVWRVNYDLTGFSTVMNDSQLYNAYVVQRCSKNDKIYIVDDNSRVFEVDSDGSNDRILLNSNITAAAVF